MKTNNFIPNKVGSIDSDDSYESDVFESTSGLMLVEDEIEVDSSEDDDSFADFDSNFEQDADDDDDDFSDINDGSSDSEDASNKPSHSQEGKSAEEKVDADDKTKSHLSELPKPEDDIDSDCESTSSEEITATMEDIFGTKPNIEAIKNHPPSYKTDAPILDLCFHPENELLAAGSINGDGIILRYSSEKVEEVARFKHHKKSCRQLCYNEDGSMLYSVSKDKSLIVLDSTDYQIKHHYKKAHDSAIYSFCEIDNNLCATGDDDGTVKIWDLRRSEPVVDFKCGEHTVTSLLACSRKKYLTATLADGSLSAFSIPRTCIEVQSELHDTEFTCQALIRDESRLVVGTDSEKILIFKSGEFGLPSDSMKGQPGAIQCMVPITDKMIITGSDDGCIRVVHFFNHKFMGVVGQHTDFGIEGLAVSAEGFLLASCGLDEVIQFWNIENLYDKRVSTRKANRKRDAAFNLASSRVRNKKDYCRDLPVTVESDDDTKGPVSGPWLEKPEVEGVEKNEKVEKEN